MLVIISNSRHNQKNHVDFRFQLHAKHAPDVIEHHENFKSIWLLKSENKSDTVPGTCGQVPAILVGHPCQTFSLSARSTRRRAGQKQAGELGKHQFNPAVTMNIHNAVVYQSGTEIFTCPAPKLEAARSH
ncbi:hypothetical protein PSTT_12913 [Puccinia striiformis]|uniref:Uncharacterized protein n=1 Tax=Puccinia striiformis TaxID=27350 RepID=A0A2S4UU24_9BASI|nr:hypothetical protein PSTT_12913 [Puccinia striiformis]